MVEDKQTEKPTKEFNADELPSQTNLSLPRVPGSGPWKSSKTGRKVMVVKHDAHKEVVLYRVDGMGRQPISTYGADDPMLQFHIHADVIREFHDADDRGVDRPVIQQTERKCVREVTSDVMFEGEVDPSDPSIVRVVLVS